MLFGLDRKNTTHSISARGNSARVRPARSAAVDIGTVNTLIAVRDKGIVLREPTVAALSQGEGREVLAVGREALQLAGRAPGGVTVVYPMRQGAVADSELVSYMLRRFLEKATGKRHGGLGMRLALCYPMCASEIEKQALTDAARAAGVREALLIEEPVAAAYGALINMDEPVGNMLIDIGGGTTDAAVVVLGAVASSATERSGGRNIDAAIAEYVRERYSVAIGERTAESVKLALAGALPRGDDRMSARGRNINTGLPASVILSAAEVCHAVAPVVKRTVDTVKRALAVTPPELIGDLMDNGITLTGGGALLKDIDRLISHETGLRVRVDECPLDAVVTGALALLDSPREAEEVV